MQYTRLFGQDFLMLLSDSLDLLAIIDNHLSSTTMQAHLPIEIP